MNMEVISGFYINFLQCYFQYYIWLLVLNLCSTHASWLFSCFSLSSMLRKYEKQIDVPFVSIAYIKYISIMTISTTKSSLSYLYAFTFVDMCCCIPDKFYQNVQLKNRKKIIRLYFIKNIWKSTFHDDCYEFLILRMNIFQISNMEKYIVNVICNFVFVHVCVYMKEKEK